MKGKERRGNEDLERARRNDLVIEGLLLSGELCRTSGSAKRTEWRHRAVRRLFEVR